MQGTDGPGILGGPDVRRRIPIKLISKQAVRSKPVTRSQRPASRLPSKIQPGEDGKQTLLVLKGTMIKLKNSEQLPCFLDEFAFKLEERFECKSGDAFGSQRRFPQPMFWDYKVILFSI